MPDALETAARLRALGWDPVIAPLFQVKRRVMLAAPSQAILISSGNAVDSLPPTWNVPLLAVGDRTAARARAAGFKDVTSADGDAQDLAALARERCPPGAALLLATGAGQGRPLAAALRQAGFRVHRRVAYATQPARRLPEVAHAALNSGQLRAILFLSAETARIFRALVPDDAHGSLCEVDAMAIAAPVAAILGDLPWRQLLVSAKPTVERVLALL